MITSFGYKHGGAPQGVLPALVFDVRRTCPNPWGLKNLRLFSGLHPVLVAWFQGRPAVERQIRRIVRDMEDHPGGFPDVAIGCTGGYHRSVYIAQAVADRLSLPVQHRDLWKHRL